MKLIPVILSGGDGTRLWPLSQQSKPKQFLSFPKFSKTSLTLFQQTLVRISGLTEESPIVVCNSEHRFLVAEQLREINISHAKIILEPIGRNTAPAVALAAFLAQNEGDYALLVLPSDHRIQEIKVFLNAVSLGLQYVKENYLFTFGIHPTKPEINYGYIELGEPFCSDGIFHVKKFVEKPPIEIAKTFLLSGQHYWNSGMFLFSGTAYLKEMELCDRELYESVKDAYRTHYQDLDFVRIDEKKFLNCKDISIDYAVMEKTPNALIIPLACQWSDLGSWNSIKENSEADEKGNVTQGNVMAEETKNCYLHSNSRLLVTLGVQNLTVVDTNDVVLILENSKTKKIKAVVQKLEHSGRIKFIQNRKHSCPWGYYEIISQGDGFRIKKICLETKKGIALQSHQYRTEHWVIINGEAKIIRDKEQFILKSNESMFIAPDIKHSIYNLSENQLIIVVIQIGSSVCDE